MRPIYQNVKLNCAAPHSFMACVSVPPCVVLDCAVGWADCNNNPADGCEVNTRAQKSNCGGCGVQCAPNESCIDGVCASSCAAPLVMCSGLCVDLQSNDANCGACGVAVPAGQGCLNGAPSPTQSGQPAPPACPLCDRCAGDANNCTDFASQPFCGVCGNACTTYATSNIPSNWGCVTGQCLDCPAGLTNCAANPAVDRQCEDLAREDSNCGACGNVCAADEACVGSSCVAVSSLAIYTGAVSDLASDGTTVFFLDYNGGGVYSVPIGGGPVTTLASGQANPIDIAVDGTTVYWLNSPLQFQGTINSVPKGGGVVTTLQMGLLGPSNLLIVPTICIG